MNNYYEIIKNSNTLRLQFKTFLMTPLGHLQSHVSFKCKAF